MPEYRVAKKRGKAKVKIGWKRQAAMEKIVDAYSEDLDVKMAVIQELIPLGLRAVAEELQSEVKRLAGKRHERGGAIARWGKQNGSVYLRDQKFPIGVPRVRNTQTNTEVRLAAYERMQKPYAGDKQTVMKLLHGLSTHQYERSASLGAEVFGISASNLSRRFKKVTAVTLEQFYNRSLSGLEIVCIFIDAKRYAKDGLMVAMGVTLEGKKLFLGTEQLHTENTRAIEQWLNRLIERGLRFEEGILFIIDGSKGIKQAVERRFGPYAFIQRCQWHKAENVGSYLNDAQKALARQRMKEAYGKTTHKEAQTELLKIHKELRDVNESAAASLAEGLEETLMLHRLGLSPELSKSLNTTNCIESVMSQLGQFTDKVDRWHNSNQLLCWTAASLMEIEPRLHKIRGFRYLSVLRFKMQAIIKQRQEKNSPEEFPTSQSMATDEIVDSRAD
jgi:putative transposase